MTSPYGQWQGNPGQWSTAASPWPPPAAHHPPVVRDRRPAANLAVAAAVVVLGIAIALVAALSVPTTSGYANESYSPPAPDLSPPPAPKVTSSEQARQTVTANAVYGQSVAAPTRCVLPKTDPISMGAEELEPYLNDVVGCLMAVWSDPIVAAGYTLPRPPVIVYSAPITTGCGTVPMRNAFYCALDQKIYYATDIMDDLPVDVKQGRMVAETTIAHEFGHAIQGRTGIFGAGGYLQYDATSAAEVDALSRQAELQADCFSGLFIRSVGRSVALTQHDLDVIAESARIIGDDTLSGVTTHDHGRGENRQYWTQLGMASTSIGVCNTFVASADVVS